MHVPIRDQNEMDVCAGATSGRVLLSKLLAQTTREPDSPEPIALDFSGITVATASFLRESVIAFRNIIRGRRSNYYPMVTNLESVVAEELDDILQARGDAILAGDLDTFGAIRNIRTLGRLEPKQKRIFELIQKRGEIDAGQLQREFGDSDGVKQTAWNNRLAALATAGLIVELSQGRNKLYKPLFEDA